MQAQLVLCNIIISHYQKYRISNDRFASMVPKKGINDALHADDYQWCTYKGFCTQSPMTRPSMDYVDEGDLILFPDATHWVQHDAVEEVKHYLVDFLLDKVSQAVKRCKKNEYQLWRLLLDNYPA